MRRLITAMLSWIPFDARSRRALDETLLDWAHETSAAATPFARIIVNLRSGLALLRTLVFASAAETWRVPAPWFVSRLLILVILPASLMTWATFDDFATQLKWPSATALEAFAMLVPSTAMLIAPMAFFYFPGWKPRRRPVPPLGLALVAACLTLLAASWIVPAANQRFREVVYTTLNSGVLANTAHLRHGLPEMTLPELVSQAFGDADAAGQVIFRFGLVAAAGAFVCAGSVLGGSRRRRLAAWAAPIACLYAVFGLAALLRTAGVHHSLASGLSLWTFTITAIVTAVLLRPASAPASPPAGQTG